MLIKGDPEESHLLADTARRVRGSVLPGGKS
jgi:hypothetical protein